MGEQMMAREYLHRYTDLTSLIHILTSKNLTLLNPETWDDKNDAYFMAAYKAKSKAKTILALCFSERTQQTYHHWKVFANGPAGVCITFRKPDLLTSLPRGSGILHRTMKYYSFDDANKLKKNVDDLPFIKRNYFKDEREYRIVYSDAKAVLPSYDVRIDCAWIVKITLSPWMHKALAQSVRETLRLIPGCKGLRVVHSTLTSSERWKKLTDRV